MADTSLVFSLLAKDNVSRVLGVVKGAFRSAGQQAESAMDKASASTARLDRQIEETERDLAQLNAEFAATGDKTLFGKIARDRTLLTQLRRVRDDIDQTNERLRDTGDSADQASGRISRLASAFSGGIGAIGSFGGAAMAAVSSLWGLVAALVAAGAAFAAIGPSAALAGGALGSLPGLITGGVAAVGTLKLGLFGLTDEYKRLTTATGGGGGGATKAAKDFTAANRAVEQAVKGVARAERDVRDAQKAALEAQRAINDAREEASDRLRDQALDLKDAQLDQAEATADVADAEKELATAQASRDPEKIADAQRAYDRAVLSLERSKNRVTDLTEANAENAQKGVEGSDEVVAAKKREEEARRRVADAQQAEVDAEQRLADARKSLADQKAQAAAPSGGGGGGQQVTKLAPSAREFLNTILRLRPAFEQLRLQVQERLFAGLATRLQHLADVWRGPLTSTLTKFAGTFNGIAKTLFASVSKQSFIDNITAGADSARKMIDRIGQAVAGPLVDAFGRLSAAAGPFLEKIGDLIARAVEKFSAWIAKADESGKLKSFFEQAATMLEKVATVGGKAFTIAGQIIGILFGDSMAKGGSALDSANNALTKVSTWLENPKNQQGVRDFVDGFMAFAEWAFNAAKAIWDFSRTAIRAVAGVIQWFGNMRTRVAAAWNGVRSAFGSAVNWISTRGNQLVNWVAGLPRRISRAASGMWNGIRDSFRGAINWIIARWNNLSFSLPSVTVPLLGTVGGGRIDTPNIPFLARGGNVQRSGMAVVGEAGPELVSLSRGAQVTPLSGGGGAVRVELDVTAADDELARLFSKMIRVRPAFAAAVKSALT